MAYLSAVSAYIPDGTDTAGRPRHLSRRPADMLSVHQMVELAAAQLDPQLLSAAGASMAASFHCGTLYQGEHFWPLQNSIQQSLLGQITAGAATELRQFCSGGLYGLMLADALLDKGWAGDYAMVTGGDSFHYFDRYDYAASPVTEGSLMGDSAFCAILNRNNGFAQIVSSAARSHNPSADMMRSRADRGRDDPAFPGLDNWIARFEQYDRQSGGSVAANAMASFRTAIAVIIECYRRAERDPDEIAWFAPSFIGPRRITEALARESGLRPTPGLHEFAEQFGHLTVTDFGLNLAYLMNGKLAKVGDLVLLFSAGNFVNCAAVLIRIEKEVVLPLNATAQ
ncbi:3-oxoacyl-[acyl-carrier-protein] synthase III C-terminal domain-containing protein [Mycolicibacterium sp. CBMA 226]|uniref:3-oxoacyl-[acyl-carrier-protein] synthase III C-terminal domain-containing protein n=1 Tax=Mycolicibacterium sp. CBMA 226 TaxID=2606611 RepID=UPI0013197F20|nr:3-oxoacyl-[acyl-carrier-protein] synthase III C-terminal domain-containing protein [Mycolicibacterium sp. CBMA 226]QGW61172.1 hypothetical protein ICEMyc226_00140 [Mycolicibacterium sp.]